MHVTIERLEKARKLLDKKHLLQLKEMNRRYVRLHPACSGDKLLTMGQ